MDQGKSYSFRALFVGRSRRDTVVWIVGLALAAFTIWRATKTGTGWAVAIGLVVMVVLYTFVPWLEPLRERNEAARLKKLYGTVTIDDWGVTRVSGDLREAVAWKDLDWVGIRTTGEGPWREDFFYLLGDAGGKGVVVPNFLAIDLNLMDALHERLPGIDYKQSIAAAGSTTDAVVTIWRRAEPPGSPPPAAPLN